MAWDRDHEQVVRQTDGVVSFELPFDVARAVADVRTVEDALAAEATPEGLVVRHVVAVGEEHRPDTAKGGDPVDEGSRCAR